MSGRSLPLLFCFLFCSTVCLSGRPSNLPVKRIGDREIAVSKHTFVFPWYHVKADHNEIRSDSVWQRINAVPGTKTSYVARYGEIEWHEEQVKKGKMRFRGDRNYVICLDRIPERTFTNMAKNPSCTLGQDES